jgi:predicted ATPase/DNA-binding SARP family transcriptional activator
VSEPGELEIGLLGAVEARVGGEPAPLGGRRQQALLALLVLDPGRPMPADRIAEELWHGAPPPGWETTLRSYASRLRRAVGAEAVVARGGGYAFDVDAATDAGRFEALVAEGREALARGAAGLAADRLRAALALWRGAALAGVADDGLLAAEARRLEELRREALEDRLDADLALGSHDAVLAELRGIVEREPLRERPRRQLAVALYRSGRQEEALEVLRTARATLDEQLGLEPSEELRRLERDILRQEVAMVAPAEVLHNLPAPATSFLGREREQAELEALLRGHRLVTVTGMGGSGKTRLALHVAQATAARWSDGVWLVDLTALGDPDLVAGAVAAVVGVDDGAALAEHLRGRELLLVLDNCEHLVVGCARLAAGLLAACPHVRVLATSRVPLAVPGEVDYALDPLPAEVAVRLFLDRAADVRRGVAAQEGAGDLAAAICEELDGLPLSIELAAARTRVLSLAEIAQRLDDRFRFLRAWQRVADQRHETLQATMDWSYELLADDEQRLLRRLSVFAGGAALDAVAAICVDGDQDRALSLLGRLVDASLVRVETGAGGTRYLLLETVRQYARARLDTDGDAEGVRRRHAEHYLELARACNLALLAVGHGPQRHEPVLREQHNLRAALDWASAADLELALRLMIALENFWITQALHEGRRRYVELLAQPALDELDPELVGWAMLDAGGCHDVLELYDEARALYERCRDRFRAVGDEWGAAHATFRLGVVHAAQRDVDAALRIYEETLAVFRAHGDEMGVIQAGGSIGGLLMDRGDERGRPMLVDAVEHAHRVGWVWWETRGLCSLAVRDLEAGRLDDAELLARRCIEVAGATESRAELLAALTVVASIAARRGDDERAQTLWASVDAADAAPGRFARLGHRARPPTPPAQPLRPPLPLEAAVELALR